jgi:hypothetical protein
MWRYPGILTEYWTWRGTAIARLFAPGGALLRDADIVLPGTSHLAQRLAAAILPKVGATADAGMLMDSIASGNLTYGNTEIDFSREFVAVRDSWGERHSIKTQDELGEVSPKLGRTDCCRRFRKSLTANV